MQTVFKFHSIYKQHPWGNQAIARVGDHHLLPKDKKIGEAWEISDRPDNESIICQGEYHGKSIRWLLDEHGQFVMGQKWEKGRRFPLLIKLLDAAERLSLQVHPSALVTPKLGGEPKTEILYLLDAKPKAALIAGLKKKISREQFERSLRAQTNSGENSLESLIHRIPVKRGDALFIPAGLIHAIDAGCLILEIEQNSDTTFRAYDWGRMGLDGKPRKLHIEETLDVMDFQSAEPKLIDRTFVDGIRQLTDNEYFRVESWVLSREKRLDAKTATAIHLLKGKLEINSGVGGKEAIHIGETVLLAATSHQLRPLEKDTEAIITWCKI